MRQIAKCLWNWKIPRPVYGHRISTSMALYGCASTNVDRELVVPLVEKVVRQTDIKNYRSPRAWLSFVIINYKL
jgi:hypothetical protein